ncbi:MAG: glycosyltransferase family 1 protein [Anaerolineae bacterium]|nr:glycosyltransferase family 1 protein [Anaerolineae bacterium]
MHVVISTFGTRGDVQPFIALALGLQQAGHHVTLVTSDTFTDWIQAYGVDTHPVHYNPQEFVEHPGTQAVMKGRGNPIRAFGIMRDVLGRATGALDELWQVVQKADFVVQSYGGAGALEAAEKLNLPSAITHLFPFTPTRAFPSPFLPFGLSRFSLGAAYNRLTHVAMWRVLWAVVGRPMTGKWRRQLGLRPWRSYGDMYAHARRLQILTLCAFSPLCFPQPPDWDETHRLTGYWFLDAPPTWQPAAELLHFVESGPPPVYIGFGSMNAGDGAKKVRLVLQALAISGQRGVVLTGGGGLARGPAAANVLYVENVPHEWLFPQMAVVVHHGGAGSTGAGLRAGVPGIIAPVVGDQFVWARQVARLGVGPQSPALKALTAEKLAAVIRAAVSDPAIRKRAAQLGDKIRAENGVAQAVEIIERRAAQAGRQ